MFRTILQRTALNSQLFNIRAAANVKCDSPKIAVVLSGCGYLDGSEIHESVSVLSHLTRNSVVPHCFAPDIKQHHVINHCTQEEVDQVRNVMYESARIARHPVHPLCKLIEKIDCFHGVIFPGGFGVAKNLSDFAINGTNFTVIPEVQEIIKKFYEAKKPIGVICIAPILIARVLPGVRITLGKDSCDKWPYRGTICQAREMGAIVEEREVNEVSADLEHLVFSTPAYMYDGEYHEIDDGIGNMVRFLVTVACRGTGAPCPPNPIK